MDTDSQVEWPNPDGFAAFSERAGEDESVVMLNLLAFRPDGGKERYEDSSSSSSTRAAKPSST